MTREDFRQVFEALDTAYGCLDLVRDDRKPVDIEDCITEVVAARDLIGTAWRAATLASEAPR